MLAPSTAHAGVSSTQRKQHHRLSLSLHTKRLFCVRPAVVVAGRAARSAFGLWSFPYLLVFACCVCDAGANAVSGYGVETRPGVVPKDPRKHEGMDQTVSCCPIYLDNRYQVDSREPRRLSTRAYGSWCGAAKHSGSPMGILALLKPVLLSMPALFTPLAAYSQSDVDDSDESPF